MRTRTIVLLRRGLAALAVFTFPLAAAADEPSERPATWDMSLDELRAIGLGQYRGDAIPVPQDDPRLQGRVPPKHAKQGVIFVNFDGETINSGGDNSQSNTSQIWGGSFAAYGEGAMKDAVMDAVRADWGEYNVVVTDSRPASGDYTMNMTGPTNFVGQGVLGIAPLDCLDMQTHNNITYAFHSPSDGFPATVQATTIGQEVAHSYGLEHVDNPGDVMNPFNAGGDATFTDVCTAIVQQLSCPQQHGMFCDDGGYSQNAHQELLFLFGPSAPDVTAPTVEIVAPQDGDTFPVGAEFEITVQAADDTALEVLTLFNGGEMVETDDNEPYGWDVTNIPEGEYQFYVIARDLAGNEAESNTVVVIVGDPPQSEDTSAGDSAGSGDGTGEGGETDSASSGQASGEGGGDDKGCGCAQPVAPGWSMALLLFAPLVRRRSRRR